MDYTNNTVENVLPLLLEWIESGQRVCLATLYHSYGTSPRPVGSQMAIAENGCWFGYLSGGCVEQAIADEGVAVIKQEQNRSVRYGVGSPYLDIQLPCGAGVDVWFDQSIQKAQLEIALEKINSRRPNGFECDTTMISSQTVSVEPSLQELAPLSFRRWYVPRRRLYVIGAGPTVTSLASLAFAADYQLHILTPNQQTYEEIKLLGHNVSLLTSHSQIEALPTDAWTSVVLMFHEHERETQILSSFLQSDVVYIGALGSTRTHNIRLDLLKEANINSEQCARIHGPVGLQIQAKTSMEIAISILAELTLTYQQAAAPLLDWGNGEVVQPVD